jgi:hypothetical protein
VPHAAHNAYLEGELRMKLGALRVDLDTVWAKYGPSTPSKPAGVFLEVGDPALDWRFDFNVSVQSKSLRFVEDWRKSPEGAAAVATFDRRLSAKLAEMPRYRLEETTGLAATVDMPGSFDEVVRLLYPSAYIDDPLAAAALAPQSERDLGVCGILLGRVSWAEQLHGGKYCRGLRRHARQGTVRVPGLQQWH